MVATDTSWIVSDSSLYLINTTSKFPSILVASRQPPADVDQSRRGSDMRSSPWQSYVAQVRRVMHKQLGDDMVAQQVYDLCISRRKDLRQRGSKGEACNHVHVSDNLC